MVRGRQWPRLFVSQMEQCNLSQPQSARRGGGQWPPAGGALLVCCGNVIQRRAQGSARLGTARSLRSATVTTRRTHAHLPTPNRCPHVANRTLDATRARPIARATAVLGQAPPQLPGLPAMQGAEGALPAGLARRPAAAVRAVSSLAPGLRLRPAAWRREGLEAEEEAGRLCVLPSLLRETLS